MGLSRVNINLSSYTIDPHGWPKQEKQMNDRHLELRHPFSLRLIAERLRRNVSTGLLATAIITTTGHASQVIVKPDFTITFADNWSLPSNGNGSSTSFRVEDTSNLAFAVGSVTQLSANISLDDAAPSILSRGPFVDSGRVHLGIQDFIFTVYGDTTSSRIQLNYGFYAISGGKWFVLALVFNDKDS